MRCGFGWLTDRIGRKKLFFITLALYLTAPQQQRAAWSVASYALLRLPDRRRYRRRICRNQLDDPGTGAAARYRGWTDLVINGSLGLRHRRGRRHRALPAVAPDHGWRLAYLIGAGLGLIVFVMRMWKFSGSQALADDPWPAAHAIVNDIEKAATLHPDHRAEVCVGNLAEDAQPYAAGALVHDLPDAFGGRTGADGRAGVFYNAIFFTFRAALTDFFGAPQSVSAGWVRSRHGSRGFLSAAVDTLGRRAIVR